MADEKPNHQENAEDDFANEEINNLAIIESNSQLEPVYAYPEHRDPAYRPWLIPTGPRKPTRYEEMQALMAKNLNYAVFGARCAFVFSIFILLDFLLPKIPMEAEVVAVKRSHAGSYQLLLGDSTVINISKKTMQSLRGNKLTVLRTRFFNVPYRLTDKENNSAGVEISIYGNFSFGPLALLVTSLFGVLRKKGTEFRFNLGVSSVVIALLNIAFLNVHKF
ncbi:hypothetical protein WSM22_21010 [Cytophagales bacterium WSM2-2]|nr:hypothetical protein WSM22_21010 [Cytophagales bacterium WSM2-2]